MMDKPGDSRGVHDQDAVTIGAPRTFSAGEILAGRFRIVRFIAQGSMGEVDEADDLVFAIGSP